MSTSNQMDLSPGMPKGIGVVPLADITARVVGYCTHPKSGWQTYDMLGAVARRNGQFNEIAPWSLLWAVALAGRISVSDIAGFTYDFRSKLADRLQALPHKELADMDDEDLDALTLLCRSGFAGAWAPKITKMLALYRPDAVPVLDGHVALAMGFRRDGFRSGQEPRWKRIRQTLMALRTILRQQHDGLVQIRNQVAHTVPDIYEVTDLRLLDIAIWASQDDRMFRPGSPTDYWLSRGGHGYRPDRLAPVPVH